MIMSYDTLGRPIRKYKNYFVWKAENGFYEARKNSDVPTELGELVFCIKGLRNIKNRIDND